MFGPISNTSRQIRHHNESSRTRMDTEQRPTATHHMAADMVAKEAETTTLLVTTIATMATALLTQRHHPHRPPAQRAHQQTTLHNTLNTTRNNPAEIPMLLTADTKTTLPTTSTTH